TCLATRQMRGSIHRQREVLLESPLPETALPPLDYVLSRLDQLPAMLAETQAMETPLPVCPPLRSARTTLYVWGYGPPRSLLCRDFCGDSEAAAELALRSGWERLRRGAWAKELTRPLGLREMLAEVGPELRRDPAVAGWGLRTKREA